MTAGLVAVGQVAVGQAAVAGLQAVRYPSVARSGPMDELVPNLDNCEKFEANPFKKEKCKHCGNPWTHHKGVISEEMLNEERPKAEARACLVAAIQHRGVAGLRAAIEKGNIAGLRADEIEAAEEVLYEEERRVSARSYLVEAMQSRGIAGLRAATC